MITQSEHGGPWVHCNCFHPHLDTTVGSCQRCRTDIGPDDEYMESTCNGRPGFCHLACATKRKRTSEVAVKLEHNADDENDDDDDYDKFQSSQDSLGSASVLTTPTKRARK